MQQERASGRTIRGCLAIRGYASAAGVTLVRQSFRLCTALFRGGSISRLPPPTEIQKWFGTGTIHRAAENWQKLALASEHHRGRDSAGGTGSYGVCD